MIILLFLAQKEANIENRKTESWKKYTSQGIGIEFEIPSTLHAFPLREVNFSESENDPSSIDVNTEFVGAKTVQEAMQDLKVEQNQKIISKKTVDGSEAVITVSNHEDSDQQQKTMYLVRGNLLYIISSRWIDQERFWSSIKFLREDF